MRSIKKHIEKIIPYIKNGLLPALLFGIAAISYSLYGGYSSATNLSFHALCYVLNLGIFMVLLYFNQSKPVFFVFCYTLAYLVINFLKNAQPDNFLNSPAYQNLCLILPLNLLFFFFWKNNRLLSKTNIYILLSLFTEYAVIEHLSRQGINLNLWSNPQKSLSGLALGTFVLTLIISFATISVRKDILSNGLFYAFFCLFLGLSNAASASGLSLFFCVAATITLLSLSLNIYNETYKDPLTGLDSRNSYIIHTKNFPLKYCIGIVSIDDYDKLKSFGLRNRNIIAQLIANQISTQEKEEHIYRYSDDEFVIIYRNLDKKESFQKLEEIRRSIAAASFQYHPHRKALKLTVSCAVSEKKRSDANSYEVLVRADKALQKTRSFSHNVTSQA